MWRKKEKNIDVLWMWVENTCWKWYTAAYSGLQPVVSWTVICPCQLTICYVLLMSWLLLLTCCQHYWCTVMKLTNRFMSCFFLMNIVNQVDINQSINAEFVGRRYTTRPGAPTESVKSTIKKYILESFSKCTGISNIMKVGWKSVSGGWTGVEEATFTKSCSCSWHNRTRYHAVDAAWKSCVRTHGIKPFTVTWKQYKTVCCSLFKIYV